MCGHERTWSADSSFTASSENPPRPEELARRRTNRTTVTPKARAAVVLLAVAMALPVAGLAVLAQSRAVFKGSVLDQAARVVSGARVVLTNTETKQQYEVASDDAGQFTLADLPTGRYAVDVRRPGFMTVKAVVVLAEEGGQGKFQLKLGSLQEMVMVTLSAVDAAAAAGPTVPRLGGTRHASTANPST